MAGHVFDVPNYTGLGGVVDGGTIGGLVAANNLSDLLSAAAARTNLGLGSAAVQAASAFDPAGAAASAVASIPLADATHNGLLSAADWTTFNSKQAALTTGNISETTSNVLTITGGTGAVIGSGVTIQMTRATASNSGYLLSTDWQAFNAKQNALTLGSVTESGSSVLTITGGTGAVVGAAGVAISVKAASTSQSGYLSSTDWNTFNSKQAALTVTNDTNVTASLTGGALTLGWAGTLAKARQHAATVYNDQTNAYTVQQAFAQGATFDAPVTFTTNALAAFAGGLQVTNFLSFTGSMYYQPGATTFFTSGNVPGQVWYEYAYFVSNGAGGVQANDEFWLSVNARTTSGGADIWSPAMRVKAVTGAVTFPNAVTFETALTATAVTGTNGTIVAKVSGQASIDLWNSTTGGTPSTGSRWRIFADNSGGGGGTLTFGMYDVANSRLVGGFDNSGWFAASLGLNIGNAANVNIGAGWLTWSPTITAFSSMTVSSVNIIDGQYLRFGPLVHSKLYMTLTLGGTASNAIFVTLPVSLAGVLSAVACAVKVAGGLWNASWGFADPSGNLLKIQLNSEANFPLGSTQILVSFFYRCA